MKDHDHIVYGCLLHDIGKFFERAEALQDYRKNEDKKQVSAYVMSFKPNLV